MTFNEIVNRLAQISDGRQLNVYFQGELLRIIRNADVDVYNTFFTDKERSGDFEIYNGYDANIKELAVKFVSYIITQIPTHSFNSTVTMNYAMLQQWYTKNEKDVGILMYKKFLIEVRGFGQYFSNPEQYAQIIEETMTSSTFISSSEFNYLSRRTNLFYLVLFFLKLLDNNGERYAKVIDFFKGLQQTYSVVSNIDGYQWFYPFKQQGEIYVMSQQIQGTVTKALNISTDNSIVNIYGEKASLWLNSDNGPRLYNIRTNKNPSNITKSTGGNIGIGGTANNSGGSADISGCVARGTKILMCDGTNKDIENIKEWDKVLSKDGKASTCSDELIYNKKLTMLYSINSQEPFMSLDHAVKTQRGWCSVNPDISNEINGNYNVKKLEVGDTVYKVENIENGVITYCEEVVENINIKEYPKGEIEAYDIHFREGYMSYHCNGYLCLLNYPEITGKRITENINNNLNEDERAVFMSVINDNSTIFEKVFGRQAMDYLNF